ncbi:MAG: serine/threonine-protein kinase [Acidobacteriota bacterium]
MTLESGVRVGKYVVGRKLGQGGFGILHAARDTELDRDVAIKFLRPEHVFKPTVVQRFLQEARAAARINHPGIVTVYESGIVGGTDTRADGTVYIAMELLSGETLAQRLKRAGSLPVPVAAGIARQLAAALAAAHASGIVHRDLKPQNVYLVPDPAVVGGERVKILDFGIAKLVDDFGSNVQTHSMLMLGTPMYMSPEQCKSSAKVDARSDIYALGCMLFELVCGRPPFDGDSGELIAKHQLVPPPTARSLVRTLPGELDALVSAMLAKSPADRPQTMDAVLDALRPLEGVAPEDGPTLTDEPATTPRGDPPNTTLTEGAVSRPTGERTSRRRGIYLGAGAAVVLGVLAGVVVVKGGHDEPPATAAAPGSALREAAPMIAVADAPDASPALDAAFAPPPPIDEVGQLRVECLGYQTEKKWQDMANCAARLADKDPAGGAALGTRAKAEQANELASSMVDEAVKRGDLAKARKLLDKIDGDSVYKKQATSAYEGLLAKDIEELRARAARFAAAKKCGDLERVVKAASALGPEVADAVRAIHCGEVAVATSAAPAACDADALDEKARNDEAVGRHAAALASFEAAIACKPTDRRYQLAFMSACNAGNADKAREYYPKVVGNRESLSQMCYRNNITKQMLTACDADVLDEKARQLEATGRHAEALADFEGAIACKPTDRRYQLAFMSACNAANLAKAKLFYKKIAGNRSNLAMMCVRNGIKVSDLEAP